MNTPHSGLRTRASASSIPLCLRSNSDGAKALRLVPALSLFLATGVLARAAIWDGGVAGDGTDWGNVSNWVGDTLPTSFETVSFNTTNPQYGYPMTVTNGSAVVTGIGVTGFQVGQVVSGTGITAGTTIIAIGANSITLSNPFTGVTGSGPITVNNVGGIASGLTINLGATRTIELLGLNNSNAFTLGSAADITAGYGLNLTNVTRSGSTAVTIATNVNLSANVTGRSTWRDTSNGTTTVLGGVSSTGSIVLNKGGTNGNVVLNGANTFTGSVVVDAGSFSLGGTNTYTGSSTASGGTFIVNFNANTAATPTTDIINASSTAILGGVRGGGTLTVSGKNAANSVNSQTFNGLVLNAGASSLTITNGIASGKTLVNLGAITHNAGGTVNFTQPTNNTTISAQNGYTTSSLNDAGGILGAWATVGGTEYATNNGTNIVAYTGYTDQAGNVLANSPTTNLRITSATTGNVTQDVGTSSVNTIRVNDAAARTIVVGTGNTLRTNGVLATGTNGLTIGEASNAGILTAGYADNAAGELVINNSTAVTVNSAITDNGTGAVGLTKTGSGTLAISSASTYTGGTVVNAGTVNLANAATDQLSTVGAITVTGGTLNLGTGSAQSTSGAVTIANGTLTGGTLTKSGASFDVRSGTINTKLAGSAGLDKATSGSLTFTNTVANTFTGDTVITEGSVTGSTAASVISISGNLIVGSASGGNAASYSNNGNNVNFASNKNVTVYSNGSVNFGGGAQNLSGTINIIGGSLTGTQIYNQNATYNLTGGTLSGSYFSSGMTYNILASANTSTISNYTAAGGQTFNVADGAAVIDLAYSGTLNGGNVLNKNGLGTMVSSSTSSNYTGITNVNAGTLAVTNLANGGTSSAIGAATNAAANIKIGDGATFRYVGDGASTDRLFTVNGSAAGHSATVESSGTGAVNFTNTGSIAWNTAGQTRTLKLGGTNTGNNTLAALIANNGAGVVSLTKQDSGKWVLSNANTYTGATSVNDGRLVLDSTGSIAAASALNIGATGVFDVSAKSTYALGTGGVKIAIGAGTAGFFDAGAAALTIGNALTLDFTSSIVAGSYNLFDFGSHTGDFSGVNVTGSIVGSLISGGGDTWTGSVGGYNLNFSEATGLLNVSAVPEPSTYALFGGALILGYVVYRRSRRQGA